MPTRPTRPISPRPVIFTIGYAALPSPAALDGLVGPNRLTLVDVRGVPRSRKPGWHGAALRGRFGHSYIQKGKVLAGPKYGGVTLEGLEWLRKMAPTTVGPMLLLCAEHAPGDCHRHFSIATALLPDIECYHIFEDHIVTATDLEAALTDGDTDEDEYLAEDFTACVARVCPDRSLTFPWPPRR